MSISHQKQVKNYRYYVDSNIGSELTRKTLVLILAGGAGSRLKGLTKWRAKPAVPFGGKYRIIDFALSNCVNSGFRWKQPALPNGFRFNGWSPDPKKGTDRRS